MDKASNAAQSAQESLQEVPIYFICLKITNAKYIIDSYNK